MLVKDVCARDVKACGPEESLVQAAAAMWSFDCGILPVIDDDRRLLGVVTDRDICMAAATRDQRASRLLVREVLTVDPVVCGPHEDLSAVLARMAGAQLRRLPVVDVDGTLLGKLSICDVLRREDLAPEALRTLRAIAEPRRRDLEEYGSAALVLSR
jgi:CBS domain-containing protein